MVSCRVVDNAGVALAAINRHPVATARVMALAHPRPHGATLFGLPAAIRVQAEWACWANATAVENWTCMIVCRRAPIRATISRR